MSWTYRKAIERINRLKNSVPNVTVENFTDQYMPRYERLVELAAREDRRVGRPLSGLSNQEAVLVDAVHVYVNLLNFNDYLLGDGRETEGSHKRALEFLHLHYAACDRAVDACGAQRVDFHGQRLHAVVVEPAGDANRLERIRKALSLAETMRRLASLANDSLGVSLAGRYRIGVDSGMCVAIKGGRGHEPEPLFVGHAANYAAKLAEGPDAGVFVSDRVADALNSQTVFRTARTTFLVEGRAAFDAGSSSTFDVAEASTRLMADWQADIKSERATTPSAAFSFHFHEPPLRGIDYGDLVPSNSIRMPLLSVFADIDGYTNYVHEAMSDRASLASAVKNLHVIRGEMSGVLREDFEGKKVRFIGDCIHGLFAVGSRLETNKQDTVGRGVHLAGAIRSSFNLCKENLEGIDTLGLAIGLELGETPISRIGLRGDQSVRVAVSKATAESERVQRRSDGRTTAIGPNALAEGPPAVRRLFGSGSATNLDYDVAYLQIPIGDASLASPAVVGAAEVKAHVAPSYRP
jgi:class 3 adenylate cyclase